jgi:hypothetical protein
MNKIEEKNSELCEDEEDDYDDDECEEFGRSEDHLDLDRVEVVGSTPKDRGSKPIISQQEAEQIIALTDKAEKKKAALAIQEQEISRQQIPLNMKTERGLIEALKFKMRIFDYHYDFQTDTMSYNESELLQNPSLEELYYYCKYVIISGRMEKEIPILCLIYLERFFTKTGILMNYGNWKRLTLISLILASKIWDDDSLENVHFP